MIKFFRQNGSVLLLLALICFTAIFSEWAGAILEYQRPAIFAGQYYRLLTAHLVHTNFNHALMNLVGLLLIWSIAFRYISLRDWWLTLLLSAVVVSVGLVLFNPDIQWYRGLSGVLHGLLFVVILKARQLPGILKFVALLGLVIKIVLEQTQTGLWQSEQLIGAVVIVDAHLYGLIGGLVSYVVIRQLKSDKMFYH